MLQHIWLYYQLYHLQWIPAQWDVFTSDDTHGEQQFPRFKHRIVLLLLLCHWALIPEAHNLPEALIMFPLISVQCLQIWNDWAEQKEEESNSLSVLMLLF